MIDTHCHLTFDVFHDRVDQVVADALAAGVRGMISVSTTSADATRAAALADRLPNVWCTAGWHPLYSDQPCDWDELRRAAANPKCVAWGELGLDNHYDKPPRPVQDRVLADELSFIQSCRDEGLEKPVIVHCRESFDDLLAVFREAPLDPSRYVFHCFTGGPDEARRVLDFGAWISFTGVVTFRNAKEVAAAAKLVPADRIMVETDAPFLTPEPHRKVWPNEPKYVGHTAEFLAALRGVDASEFEAQLDANAERFFGIELPVTS